MVDRGSGSCFQRSGWADQCPVRELVHFRAQWYVLDATEPRARPEWEAPDGPLQVVDVEDDFVASDQLFEHSCGSNSGMFMLWQTDVS